MYIVKGSRHNAFVRRADRAGSRLTADVTAPSPHKTPWNSYSVGAYKALPRGDRMVAAIGRHRSARVSPRRTMVKLIRFLFVCAVILAIAGCGFVGVTIWYFGRDLPDYQQLANYQPPIMTRVQAGDGRLLAEYATERRVFVPIQAMPSRVIDAFISAEDKNFYTHPGIDPLSIAARRDHRYRPRCGPIAGPIGASTITQQVAKNMLLTNEVSIARKIKEILLATRIEAALPKDRILELYLNEIYLGAAPMAWPRRR